MSQSSEWPQDVFQRVPGVPVVGGSSVHGLGEEWAQEEAHQSCEQHDEGGREPEGFAYLLEGGLEVRCPGSYDVRTTRETQHVVW